MTLKYCNSKSLYFYEGRNFVSVHGNFMSVHGNQGRPSQQNNFEELFSERSAENLFRVRRWPKICSESVWPNQFFRRTGYGVEQGEKFILVRLAEPGFSPNQVFVFVFVFVFHGGRGRKIPDGVIPIAVFWD